MFSNQKKPLYPHPVQWRKGIALFVGMACMMVYFAADVWASEQDPCNGGYSKLCTVAAFWSTTIGIPRYLAAAQFWGALGMMMLFIAFQLWRYRAYHEPKH